MSNRVLLRLNTGAPDGSLFATGLMHSYFRPEQWKVIADKVRQIQVEEITGSPQLGTVISIEYDKTGTILEDVKLRLTLSAVVGNGVGTYARICDFGGLALIPQVSLTYQQNTIETYSNVDLFFKHIRDHDITHRRVFAAQLGGNLTDAQRNTRATAPQSFQTYLKPYWYQLASHCPIIVALANKLKFKIQLAAAQDIVQTDYTNQATVTLQSAQSVFEVINTTGTDRDSFSKLTFTPAGQTYLIEENHDLSYVTLAAGSLKNTVDLKGFVLPFSSQYGLLQRAADLTTPWAKKPFELSVVDFQTYLQRVTIKDGSNATFIILEAPFDFADHYQKHHCKSQWLYPIICYAAAEIADLKNINLGSFNAANINNFQMVLEYKTALPVDFMLTLANFEHNWVNHQGGELQTVFN